MKTETRKPFEDSEIAKLVWAKLKYTDVKAENLNTVIEIKEVWELIEELFNKEKELQKRKMIELLEFMQKEKMQPNGFGGWGYNSVNNYGSHNEDIVKLFQKSERF